MKKTVLFIEDDVRRNQPLVNYLEKFEGWEVLWAKTPAAAIRYLRNRKHDIKAIILDIMMPPDSTVDAAKSDKGLFTGMLLLEPLKQHKKPSTPIVILSARPDLEEHLKDEPEVKEYLKKPQRPDVIVQVIEDILKEKNVHHH
ncbi:response regulator [bacterium]|nr:response regulator [bacterium]